VIGILVAWGWLLAEYEQQLNISIAQTVECREALQQSNADLTEAQTQYLRLYSSASVEKREMFYRGAFALCMLIGKQLEGYTKEQVVQNCLGVSKDMMNSKVYEELLNGNQVQ
jgi:hypothetical protein